MSAGHTPGPWQGDTDSGAIFDAHGNQVASVWALNGRRVAERAANVPLIAAAPELLEALQTWLADFDDGRSLDHDHAARFRELVARATGGSND